MLDTETKRRIDTARDILVGKVPDPKSQVEQITIALIYKFMDDMDKEAISFGGNATFFAKPKLTGNKEDDEKLEDYSKYAWTKIFDPKVGGHEMLALYGEAIVKLNLNPNIPQLFRDIFKNAYLPYRDPETLKLFLKTINEFSYDHSEMLGDAFEYLLSVLGSQGDAGQFRTPRHIIDFIVEVLQPKKTETICDPACGTAGFLISSYKHILQHNSKKNKGDLLTPDDKKKMMQNFVGYDISPDMVRLSLVNMYLHGFITPNIYEYDTLTSEDRWSEYFDVIIANPPFMTPKGGIKPHKKFTIQANKSEVLFVDYIAEHIHPSKGRAGIIIPEGIIFQSANAYKTLRKMLVDKYYLYAVVSLPAGIFNPYSGVKTSILLMDKTLAKKTDNILFVKIDNDGFDLGAQRRAIANNDLTGCLELLNQYKLSLQNKTEFESDNKNVFLVKKEIISVKGDYNLSIDRYRVNENVKQSNFEMVKLGDVCEVINGKAYKQEELLDVGKYPVLRVGNFFSNRSWYYSDLELPEDKYCDKGDLLYAWSASFGPKIWDGEKSIYHYHIWKMLPDESRINKLFLFYILDRETESIKEDGGRGIAMMHITKGGIEQREIPLPPLEIQQQIVSKVESYQAIINGAKQVVENYKPQIEINPDWAMVELGEVCEVKSGGTPSRDKEEFWKGNIPWLRSEACKDGFVSEAKEFITEKGFENSSAKVLKPKSTLIALVGATIGKTAFITFEATTNQNVAGIFPKDENKLQAEFLFYAAQLLYSEFTSLGEFRMANLSLVKGMRIPLPPLSEQQQIVTRIEQEQQLVNGNKKLISLYEQKIKDEINKLWQAEPKEYEMPQEKLSIAAEE